MLRLDVAPSAPCEARCSETLRASLRRDTACIVARRHCVHRCAETLRASTAARCTWRRRSSRPRCCCDGRHSCCRIVIGCLQHTCWFKSPQPAMGPQLAVSPQNLELTRGWQSVVAIGLTIGLALGGAGLRVGARLAREGLCDAALALRGARLSRAPSARTVAAEAVEAEAVATVAVAAVATGGGEQAGGRGEITRTRRTMRTDSAVCAPTRPCTDRTCCLAIDETVILLTLSLHRY